MACTPSQCFSNCYNDTCPTYVTACPTNTYSFGAVVAVGDTIEATHVNDLQDAIDDERFVRRGLPRDFTGQNVVAGVDNALKTDFDALRDSINEIIDLYKLDYNPPAVSPAIKIETTYPTTRVITANDIIELRAAINLLREDCSCDSECGANLVCPCDGDCGCNYSDIRLKREVVYFV